MNRLSQWKTKLKELEQKREDRINRYIIPLEIEMDNLREKIENVSPNQIEIPFDIDPHANTNTESRPKVVDTINRDVEAFKQYALPLIRRRF